MKKLIIILVVIIAVYLFVYFVYPGRNIISSFFFHSDKDKYISFVASSDYKSDLEKAPLRITDKGYNGAELTDTTVEDITQITPLHRKIAEKYKLHNIANGNGDFEKTVQIINWLTENTYYNGMQYKGVTDNSLDILEFSFGKPFENAINCRHKAIAFADCLTAIGIKAYPVCMVANDQKGNHFTCRVYISELDKWCMFDPSFGCWFSDESNNPLDIFEVRELFLSNKEPVIHGYNFNGTDKCKDVYINSFLKCCMSNLSTWQDNSLDRRDSKSFSKRKQFASGIPEK